MEGDALVRDQYTRMAHVYEERVAPRFEPIARRTVELARLQGGDRVLDVGCGTGLASLLAAGLVGARGEVVGVDFSEGQLGMAVAKAELRGAGNVRFVRADATKLPFEAEFDAVVSNLGVPADFEPAFDGMRRALKPGGRLSVAEWATQASEPFATFRALLRERAVRDAPPEVLQGREVVARRRAQFDRIGTDAGLAGALRKAGFADVQVLPQKHAVRFDGARAAWDLLLAWGWQEQEVRLLPGPEREALRGAMEERFGTQPFEASWHLLHATAVRP